jgi:hypothetical protein
VLHFDFAIFNSDDTLYGLIEFDGIQHFRPVEIFGGKKAFIQSKARDGIKNDFCRKEGIKLLRIPYFQKDVESKVVLFLAELAQIES